MGTPTLTSLWTLAKFHALTTFATSLLCAKPFVGSRPKFVFGYVLLGPISAWVNFYLGQIPLRPSSTLANLFFDLGVCLCVFVCASLEPLRGSPPKPLHKSSQVKSSQVKSSQVKSSQVKSSQVKSSQVKSSQVKSTQVKSSQVKLCSPGTPFLWEPLCWTAQHFAFFPFPAPKFRPFLLSLGSSLVELWSVFKAMSQSVRLGLFSVIL